VESTKLKTSKAPSAIHLFMLPLLERSKVRP
jgi:hypothetical protein